MWEPLSLASTNPFRPMFSPQRSCSPYIRAISQNLLVRNLLVVWDVRVRHTVRWGGFQHGRGNKSTYKLSPGSSLATRVELARCYRQVSRPSYAALRNSYLSISTLPTSNFTNTQLLQAKSAAWSLVKLMLQRLMLCWSYQRVFNEPG